MSFRLCVSVRERGPGSCSFREIRLLGVIFSKTDSHVQTVSSEVQWLRDWHGLPRNSSSKKKDFFSVNFLNTVRPYEASYSGYYWSSIGTRILFVNLVLKLLYVKFRYKRPY